MNRQLSTQNRYSPLWPRAAGWATLTAAVLTAGACLALAALNGPTLERFFAEYIVARVTCALTFAAAGALLSARRPENRIAWLMCAVGTGIGLSAVIQQYVWYTVVTRPGALPFGEPLAWLNDRAWLPLAILSIVSLLLIFPDGRLPSPRWRWAAWLGCAAALLQWMKGGLATGPAVASLLDVSSPYAPAWSAWLLAVIPPAANLLTLGSLAAALAAVVVRFHRARGIERQQMKWFAFAMIVLLAALAPEAVYSTGFPRGAWLGGALLSIGLPALPAAVGVAILRYRLDEIDTLIRRTLVYSAVSAALALIYLAILLALQSLLVALTGATSDLAVILSTLAIFALFGPLRQRIRRLVDRRFYRAQYDSERVLERFSTVARDEVDLERLSEMLVRVVDTSLKVEGVSLWLGSGEERRRVN